MSNPFIVRDILIVRFPLHNPQGREQEGIRPALVVGVPQKLGISRFSTLIVAPITTDKRQPWSSTSSNLYPKLTSGQGGLPKDSIILLDQIRAIDLNRIVRYLGTLKLEDYQPILNSLNNLLSVT
jgi:mRNA interferase MazF